MEVPVLAEELKRKVIDAMLKLVHDYQTGKATEAQTKYAMDIMWLAVAGLVDDDFRTIQEQLDAHLSYHHNKQGIDQSYMPIEVFKGSSGKTCVLVTSQDRKNMWAYVYTGEPKIYNYDFSEATDPALERLQQLSKLRKVFSS